MTQADRVHSTPPTNTSATNLPGPIDPTRRRLLTVAAGGAVAAMAIPTMAQAGSPAAPIYAAIEAFRRADAACVAVHGDIPDEVGDRWSEAISAVLRTRPATPAGLAALTTWSRERADWLKVNGTEGGDDFCTVSATIDDAARGMSGLEPWSPPPLAESAEPDAELIELGARFEPLVDRYYLAQRRWSSSSAHRRDGTADALSAVHNEMKQLANAINAASVNSIEGLRAKALVAFWEVAPLCKGETEFSFEDAYPFQQLFTAVAEACGLKDKMAATGYVLPDIGLAYDDTEEDCDDEGEDA